MTIFIETDKPVGEYVVGLWHQHLVEGGTWLKGKLDCGFCTLFQTLLPRVMQMACNGEFLCHLPKFLMLHYLSMLLQVRRANFYLE